MNIHISHNKICYGRLIPLITTLSKFHNVTINDTVDIIPSADIWLIDWYDVNMDKLTHRINSNEENFLKYKGKLLPISLDDGSFTVTIKIKNTIINRLDGWITGMIWDLDYGLYDKSLYGKFILVPRFHIDNLDIEIPLKKTNQLVFWGSTTGGLKLNNKNPRVECLKIIDSDSYLKSKFKGGLVFNYIIDSNETEEYKETYQKFVVPIISNKDWWNILSESTICLSLEGNTVFSYRPLEAMRSKATIISAPFLKDPGSWLFSDKLQNCVWFYKKDLTDFKKICETALFDVDKTKQMSDEAFDVYKTWIEDEPDKTYNSKVISQFCDKFESLTNIKLL